MLCRTVTTAAIAFLLVACGGGGGGGGNGETPAGPKAGEGCETDKATACGESFSGDEAVLICIVSGTEGAMTWNEQDTCKKHQNCVDAKSCEVDCESAFVCDGRECGDDGCGGSCGACPTGFSCNGGECQEFVCDPICGDYECGPNGCGETCGTCVGDLVCVFPGFTCETKPEGCIPDCLDKNCGPNGCGGSCGVCSAGNFCNQETLVCTSPCVPDCTGKDCGDDGCGGSCGGCAEDNEFCHPEEGTCGPCDPVTNTMCPPDQYCTYTQGVNSPVCEVAGEQGYGEPCGGTDSCKEGICISIGEGSSMCFQICKLHEDCGEGNQCIELMESPYKVCSGGGATEEDCDLLKQECKLEEEACYFDGTAMKPICQAAGTIELGEPCSGPNDCVPGHMCLNDPTGGGYKCFKLCTTEKGEEPSCDPDSAQPNCANYYAKQKAGYCND